MISGNLLDGVWIGGGGGTGNHVVANRTGTDAAGTARSGNAGAGVVTDNVADNLVGPAASSAWMSTPAGTSAMRQTASASPMPR